MKNIILGLTLSAVGLVALNVFSRDKAREFPDVPPEASSPSARKFLKQLRQANRQGLACHLQTKKTPGIEEMKTPTAPHLTKILSDFKKAFSRARPHTLPTWTVNGASLSDEQVVMFNLEYLAVVPECLAFAMDYWRLHHLAQNFALLPTEQERAEARVLIAEVLASPVSSGLQLNQHIQVLEAAAKSQLFKNCDREKTLPALAELKNRTRRESMSEGLKTDPLLSDEKKTASAKYHRRLLTLMQSEYASVQAGQRDFDALLANCRP